MLLVVINYICDGLSNKGKSGLQDSDPCEVHNMRKASCVVENFCHEAVILKERSDRFSTFLSLVLQEYLLCADLLSDLSLFMFLVNVFTKRVVVLLL